MRGSQLKGKIRSYLEEKGNYKDSDEVLINNIPVIIKVIKDAERDFTINGIIMNNKKNPALEIHSLYLNKLRETFVILGITPRERRKLEQIIIDQTDDFDRD